MAIFAAILATILATIPRRFGSPVVYTRFSEIALEIAAKIASVNGLLELWHRIQCK